MDPLIKLVQAEAQDALGLDADQGHVERLVSVAEFRVNKGVHIVTISMNNSGSRLKDHDQIGLLTYALGELL